MTIQAMLGCRQSLLNSTLVLVLQGPQSADGAAKQHEVR